ncbi:hypothetical protein BU16DRAFT_557401 [Lophium mytilinum]|uniref:Uncharacterized protein n=1 Tax=Lophium mytilinum TaxID=390894 RepID=A0A6A6R6E7_9PEZI|nr:hypothetical protein BU16DRAFT_557401 [Lophium mytilinum]
MSAANNNNNANTAAYNAANPPVRADFVFLRRDIVIPWDLTACPDCIMLSCPCGTIYRACEVHKPENDHFAALSVRVLGPTPHNTLPTPAPLVPDLEDLFAWVTPRSVIELVRAAGAGGNVAGNAFMKAPGVYTLNEICPVASVLEGVWRTKAGCVRQRRLGENGEGAAGAGGQARAV